jgi:hypothetical protein
MLRLLAAFSLGLFSGAYLIRRERVPYALLEATWDDESDEALLAEMDESIAEMLESN